MFRPPAVAFMLEADHHPPPWDWHARALPADAEFRFKRPSEHCPVALWRSYWPSRSRTIAAMQLRWPVSPLTSRRGNEFAASGARRLRHNTRSHLPLREVTAAPYNSPNGAKAAPNSAQHARPPRRNTGSGTLVSGVLL